jgi:oligopeptidase B
MCDSSIPLVSTEWDEWGNPNVVEHFQYMASYDPIRQLGARVYPPLMLTAGLHDTRVGYWEPLKYVQRQRALNAGTATTLFKCELEEGHTGAMDRYKGLKDRAFELAWVLHCLK